MTKPARATLTQAVRPPPAAPPSGLHLAGLVHRWKPNEPPALTIERLALPPGGRVAVIGPSGSGKTTLLHLLTGIAAVQDGKIRWGDAALEGMTAEARVRWRRRHVGFVFQDFHLVPGLSVVDNVLAACFFGQFRAGADDRCRAAYLLDFVGVARRHGEIATLSRGEQQRVAIARALFARPSLIVADEPTASLDAANGQRAIELLTAAATDLPATLVAVTHDPALVAAMDSVWRLADGQILVDTEQSAAADDQPPVAAA